jgi:hypothetical protein
MAQYTYPKGVVRPFAHLGMGNALIISTKNNNYDDDSLDDHRVAIDGPRKYEQSLVGGIGMKASRFQLEARYMTTTGWVPYAGSSMHVNSLQLIAGVRL